MDKENPKLKALDELMDRINAVRLAYEKGLKYDDLRKLQELRKRLQRLVAGKKGV